MIRLVTCLILLSSAVAVADPPGLTLPAGAVLQQPMLAPPGLAVVERPVRAMPPETSYRSQLIIADTAAVFAVVGGIKAESAGLAIVGVTSWVVMPALIHSAHHHGARAAQSLLLRFGLPVLGGLIGNQLGKCGSADCDDSDGQAAATALGFLVGIATATVIDDAYLGRADDAPAPQVQNLVADASPAR
jgi:hypothetical protein|nr:hypothetical protein [Kofleriaceae bacterium]